MPGIFTSRRAVLQRDGLRELVDAEPGQDDSARRGPMPEILTSWRKAARSSWVQEAEQDLGVLAHHEMGQQRDPLAETGRL